MPATTITITNLNRGCSQASALPYLSKYCKMGTFFIPFVQMKN